MIKLLAGRIVAWQVSKNYLSKQQTDLYAYGYELLISQVINLLITCLFVVVFQSRLTVVLCFITYMLLRSYAGGYHAGTHERCMAASAVTTSLLCIVIKIMPEDKILLANLIGTFVSGITIFLFAPVQDQNKPLSEAEKEQYGKFSRRIWVAETLLWIVCYLAGAKYAGFSVVMGHFTLSLMLGLGMLKNHCMSLK